MKKQYRPSNGAEGMYFIERWCSRCERDKEVNGTCHEEGREPADGDWCEILTRSYRPDSSLPEWTQPEWALASTGEPTCTQFVPMGEKIPQRDDKTIDMFGGAEND